MNIHAILFGCHSDSPSRQNPFLIHPGAHYVPVRICQICFSIGILNTNGNTKDLAQCEHLHTMGIAYRYIFGTQLKFDFVCFLIINPGRPTGFCAYCAFDADIHKELDWNVTCKYFISESDLILPGQDFDGKMVGDCI